MVLLTGDQYYRYTIHGGLDRGYPRDLAIWKGLPESIDTAVQWTDGNTYFFAGSQYYRFNDAAFRVPLACLFMHVYLECQAYI